MMSADDGELVRNKHLDQKERVREIKQCLETWKEVVVPANSVLTWDQPFHPGILFGVVTFVFLLVWYLNPSVLTLLSLIGLVVVLCDYAIPIIGKQITPASKWDNQKEKQFEDICWNVMLAGEWLRSGKAWLHDLKYLKPKVYFITILTTLILLAWIGNVINNLFLTYLVAVFLVMFPGLWRHGLLQRYCADAFGVIAGLLGGNPASTVRPKMQ